MSHYAEPEAGEWVLPRQEGYKLACCDCGLVHKMDFRVVDGKAEFRVWPATRETGQIRRHMRLTQGRPPMTAYYSEPREALTFRITDQSEAAIRSRADQSVLWNEDEGNVPTRIADALWAAVRDRESLRITLDRERAAGVHLGDEGLRADDVLQKVQAICDEWGGHDSWGVHDIYVDTLMERLAAALATSAEPKPKRKRIDWSNVVVDEGDEAP